MRFRLVWVCVLGVFCHVADLCASDPQVEITLTFEPGPKPVQHNVANPIVPSGASERPGPPDCQAAALEELLINKYDLESRKQLLSDFFARCEARLARFGQHSALSLQRLDRIQYDFLANPLVREFKIVTKENFADGRVHQDITRGVLALREGSTPRPFLLVVCGLFCSASDSALFRNLLIHGVDESPFHVMLLNSSTSAEYLLDNHRLALGGMDEGHTAFRIAEWLRFSAPFRERISSLHVAGVSNGGNAALFAAAYNSAIQIKDKSRPIDSAIALCPVVDVKPSLDFVFQRSLVRQVFYRQLMRIMQEVHPVVPSLQDRIDLNQPPSPEALGGILGSAALDYYQNLPANWALAPLTGTRFQSEIDLWNANKISSLFDGITTPTLIWAPQNDPVVNFADNTALLLNPDGSSRNPQVQILATNHGSHCGFSLAYGWDVTSAILRSHVLSQSPEFLANRTETVTPLAVPSPTLRSGEIHLSQEWIARVGASNLELRYRIFDPHGSPSPAIRCDVDPFEAPFLCLATRSVQVPLNSLNLPLLQVPTSVTEAEITTRWLNSHLRILDDQLNRLTNSTSNPAYLKAIQYN